MTNDTKIDDLRAERAWLAADLEEIEDAIAKGVAHPKSYRASFYRQQVAELDELIRTLEAAMKAEMYERPAPRKP